MKFIRYDLPKDSGSIMNFLKIHCSDIKVGDRLVTPHLVAVYDTKSVIVRMNEHIKRHGEGAQFRKYLPMWEKHLDVMRRLDESK